MTMPTHDIDAILQDLYAVDPSLSADEPRLRPLIAELLAARPDTRFDEAFARNLRAKLAAATAPKPSPFNAFLNAIMNLKSPLIPAGAVAVIALIALAVTQQPSLSPKPSSKELASAAGVSVRSATSEHAFGTLAAPSSSTAMERETGGGMGLAADAKMAAPGTLIYPEIVNYRYTFKDELPAIDAKLAVYKRVKGGGLPADAIRNLGLGVLDLNRFSNAQLQSFNLMEDREYGYAIYVDGNESMASITQNWLKWPNPTAACRDEACYQSLRVKPEDVPADAELLSIAERFLSDYGISKDGYESPVVRGEWRGQYALAADKAQFYVPESVAVVYPLSVEGKPVNDEAGYRFGLQVSVNVRTKRVDGVYNLMTQQYQSSLYESETDAAKLRSIVERGGLYGWFNPNAKKTVEIELGAPELVLTRIWLPRPNSLADELLAPALRFPILNPPADQPWFRDNVTVPLAKELIEQSQPPITIYAKDDAAP